MKKSTYILCFFLGLLVNSHAHIPAGEDVFFIQMADIFEAKKTNFSQCIGKFIKTDEDEDEEIYECTLKLEGFTTTIVKDEFGDTYFVARSVNYAIAETNVKKLLNQTIRESFGITGYTNIDDKKSNPTLYNECMNATSLYNRAPGSVNVQVCEKPSRLGFVIQVS